MPTETPETGPRDFGWPDRAIGRLSFLSAILASLLILAMMGLICIDVLSRNLFNHPLDGVDGFIAYSVVVCVFLQIGSAIRNRRLISAEFISATLDQCAPALQTALRILFSLAALGVMFFAARYLINDFIRSWTGDEFYGATGAFQLPIWPFKLAVAIGACIALVELALVLARDIRFAPLPGAGRRLLIAGAALLVFLALLYLLDGLAAAGMDRVGIGVLSLGLLLVLISLGMPIVFALMVTSFLGVWLVRDNLQIAVNLVGTASSGAVRSYGFGVIPLFVLMGLLLDKAGVGRDAFQFMAQMLRRLTGGLGIATVGANAVFAAITGSSVASATVFSRIAVPPMMEAGYDKKFALGIVAGSSVLGMLIPPSLLMIVYGLLAETSIGALFIAGIVPGLLLAGAFALLIFCMARFMPGVVGQPISPEAAGEAEQPLLSLLPRLLPVVLIVLLVMGGIYGGFFSPTEAGAVGALGAVLMALARRSLDWKTFRAVVLETGAITAGLLFLMTAANLYGRMLTMTTIPMELASIITGMGLQLITFTLVYALLVIFLGMILDSVSIMLIVLPIALPILHSLNADLTWFGIVTVIAIEIGLLTPPFGLSIYVVKGSLPPGFATLGEIFQAAMPFVLTMAAVTFLLIVFPWFATVLI